jgi:hypothetical protein
MYERHLRKDCIIFQHAVETAFIYVENETYINMHTKDFAVLIGSRHCTSRRLVHRRLRDAYEFLPSELSS